MEKTLVMIKPDGVKHRILAEVLKPIREIGHITEMRMTRLSRLQAEALYAEHKGKEFFDRNIAHVMSGPVILARIDGEDVVARCRELALSIRDKHQDLVSLPANLIHATDLPEKTETELESVGLTL
jgi:nucleoside-diphosphate kinase